jgi:hypothetical protein
VKKLLAALCGCLILTGCVPRAAAPANDSKQWIESITPANYKSSAPSAEPAPDLIVPAVSQRSRVRSGVELDVSSHFTGGVLYTAAWCGVCPGLIDKLRAAGWRVEKGSLAGKAPDFLIVELNCDDENDVRNWMTARGLSVFPTVVFCRQGVEDGSRTRQPGFDGTDADCARIVRDHYRSARPKPVTATDARPMVFPCGLAACSRVRTRAARPQANTVRPAQSPADLVRRNSANCSGGRSSAARCTMARARCTTRAPPPALASWLAAARRRVPFAATRSSRAAYQLETG